MSSKEGSSWRLAEDWTIFLCYGCQRKRADMVEQYRLTGMAVPMLPVQVTNVS